MFLTGKNRIPLTATALAVFALCTLFDSVAFAAPPGSLGCSGGGPSGGSLVGNSCSTSMGISSVFSGLVCNYKLIIDQVLSTLVCAMIYVMKPTVGAAATLFVAIFGIKLTAGTVSVKDGFLVIVKVAFVVAFASQAAWIIGVGYNFLIGLMENSMAWVTSAVLGGAVPAGNAAGTIFGILDMLMLNTLTGPASANALVLIGFLALLSQALPPLFGLVLYFFLKTLLLFVRATLTYLLAISAIAFLIALSPVFVPFMLFKTTFTFFDSWLKHLSSFVVQVMLVFAILAMWLILLQYMGDFFIQLGNAVRIVAENPMGAGQIKPLDSFGLCANYAIGSGPFGPTLACGAGGGKPIMATQLTREAPFIYFFVVNILTLTLAVYAFDAIVSQVPQIAQQLSGPKSVSAIGGSVGPSGPDFPGLKGLERGVEAAAIGAGSKESIITKVARELGKKAADKKKDGEEKKFAGLADLMRNKK